VRQPRAEVLVRRKLNEKIHVAAGFVEISVNGGTAGLQAAHVKPPTEFFYLA
jgi:hypothetical protein